MRNPSSPTTTLALSTVQVLFHKKPIVKKEKTSLIINHIMMRQSISLNEPMKAETDTGCINLDTGNTSQNGF